MNASTPPPPIDPRRSGTSGQHRASDSGSASRREEVSRAPVSGEGEGFCPGEDYSESVRPGEEVVPSGEDVDGEDAFMPFLYQFKQEYQSQPLDSSSDSSHLHTSGSADHPAASLLAERLWQRIESGMREEGAKASEPGSESKSLQSKPEYTATQPSHRLSSVVLEEESNRGSISRGATPLSTRYWFSGTSTSKWVLRVAAMLSVLVLGGVLLQYIETPSPSASSYEWRSLADILQHELPDGSVITLRPNSVLQANPDEPYRFELTGEAHFEVARNPDREFIVQTAHAQVLVTGTRFVVRSVEAETAVFLTEGGVTFTERSSGESVRMQPGEALSAGLTGIVLPLEAHPEQFLLWMDSEMTLSGRTVQDVAVELSRHFNVAIEVGPELMDLQLDGRVALDDPGSILQDIALTLGREVTRTGNGFVLE